MMVVVNPGATPTIAGHDLMVSSAATSPEIKERTKNKEANLSVSLAEHTGVVSENMQGLGAKLRKLASQAKICTQPGGEVVAKMCVLRSKDL